MPGHDNVTPEGQKFFKEIEDLVKKQVRVGFQQGTTSEDGADIVDVAMWNELGTSGAHPIPARPFLRQSVDNNEDKITAMCQTQIQAIADGRTDAEGALKAIGTMQKALIQDTIRNGDFKPNAPITIEGGWMRTKDGKPFYIKGKKSSKPLIDTGRMRQSVNFVIEEKGG
jgi:hypothetical protein